MSNEREIGALDARMAGVERQQTQILEDIRAIRDTLAQAKGGWRTVLLVAGCGSVIGALGAKLGLPWLR